MWREGRSGLNSEKETERKKERRRFGDKVKEEEELEISNAATGGDPVQNASLIFLLVLFLF